MSFLRPRAGAALAALAAVAPLLAACSGSAATPGPVAPPSGIQGGVPVGKGGTLVFASETAVSTFNLNTVEGRDSHAQLVMDRVWPQVFLVNPQARPVLDTELVQSAELTATNPQTVVYKINPKAVWSDGVPITALDFEYNWRAQSGTGTDIDGKPYDVASTAGYEDIRSVTGTDSGKTVTVVFRQPFGDWESLFSNLIPAHIAERVGWNSGFTKFNPSIVISGGPFMVASDSPLNQITLVRNPRYWGPPPNLDEIVFRYQADPSQEPAQLEARQVNMIYPVPQIPLVQATKALPGVTTRTGQSLSFEHLDFNERNPFLADVRVREAIATAVDIPALIRATADMVAKGVHPDGNRLFANSQPQYQDNANGYGEGNADAAKRLLEADNYVPGPGGILTKDGKRLELRISTTADNPLRVAAEQIIQAQLMLAGIKLDEVNTDSKTLLSQVLPSGSYDLALFAWTTSPFASMTAAIYQTANQVTGSGSENWTGFSDPQVDALYNQAQLELNPGRAASLYNQIDQQLWAKMVSLPLYQRPTLLAYDKTFANISDNGSISGPFWDAEVWGVRPAAS